MWYFRVKKSAKREEKDKYGIEFGCSTIMRMENDYANGTGSAR